MICHNPWQDQGEITNQHKRSWWTILSAKAVTCPILHVQFYMSNSPILLHSLKCSSAKVSMERCGRWRIIRASCCARMLARSVIWLHAGRFRTVGRIRSKSTQTKISVFQHLNQAIFHFNNVVYNKTGLFPLSNNVVHIILRGDLEHNRLQVEKVEQRGPQDADDAARRWSQRSGDQDGGDRDAPLFYFWCSHIRCALLPTRVAS